MTTGTAGQPAGRPVIRYKLHWHIVFTHFPVSFFVGGFGLMVLHLITHSACFELAGAAL